MSKSIAEKIGIQKGKRAIFVQAPAEVVEEMAGSELDVQAKMTGKFDYIHLFLQSEAEFHTWFPKAKEHLQQPGMLWVSWPKGKFKETGLNIKTVIKMGYDYGLVESKAISIDAVWSAIKFTWPRKGVVYKNSYGKLKNE